MRWEFLMDGGAYERSYLEVGPSLNIMVFFVVLGENLFID